MTTEQMLGWFLAACAFGWITLIALVGWLGNKTYNTMTAIRKDLHNLAVTMLPRDEFDRRHAELNARVDNAHKRLDDFWADLTDPGLGWPQGGERRRKPRE